MEALAGLERELHEANQDYMAALQEAGMSEVLTLDQLSLQLDQTLARLCTERQAARDVVDAATGVASRDPVEARNS